MTANDSNDKPPSAEDDVTTFISVKQAMEITGLAERTIREWMGNGKLKPYKVGDGKNAPVRVKKSDVMALFRPGGTAAGSAAAAS